VNDNRRNGLDATSSTRLRVRLGRCPQRQVV
jgi:hypothetical protein